MFGSYWFRNPAVSGAHGILNTRGKYRAEMVLLSGNYYNEAAKFNAGN